MPKKQKPGGNQSKKSRNTRTEAAKRRVAEQPAITERNRLRKRLKHIGRHPDDLQTAKLL